jgi:hypothetical protein
MIKTFILKKNNNIGAWTSPDSDGVPKEVICCTFVDEHFGIHRENNIRVIVSDERTPPSKTGYIGVWMKIDCGGNFGWERTRQLLRNTSGNSVFNHTDLLLRRYFFRTGRSEKKIWVNITPV